MSSHGRVWGLGVILLLAGQNCVSAERFYVQAGIYDKFVKAIVKKLEQLQQGPSCPRFKLPHDAKGREMLVIDLKSEVYHNQYFDFLHSRPGQCIILYYGLSLALSNI